MAKIGEGWDRGGRSLWPQRVFGKLKGQSTETSGFAFRSLPAGYYDYFYDFGGAIETYQLAVPLYDVTNDGHTILVGANSRGRVKVPRAGRLIAAHLLAEDALATHADNHITFTVTNELGTGSGSAEMLSTTTGANTTDSDLASAVAITAKTGRAFSLGAAANLRVAAGDHILVTATVGGTLANAVDLPIMLLTFATVPTGLTPRITRTAGSPLIAPTDDVLAGNVVLQLEATNEAQVVALDWDDQLTIDPTKPCLVQFRAQISGVAANTRFIFGLASAYNATFDSIVSNAWFRIEGNSLVVYTETDDGTTDNDDKAHGATLVAATDYTFTVDLTRGTSDIRFFVDDDGGGGVGRSLSAAALTTSTLLQPFVALQKASGTGTQSITLKWIRVVGQRY